MNYLQIPSAVWPHLSHLSGLQLAIYCDAITWTSQGKEARRSNDTLAEMFGVTSRAISKAVARMVELGFVDVEVGPNNIRTIKPRTTVHLNKRSPRTSVHHEQLFTTPLNNCSSEHGTTVHGSPEQLFTQVNHREEQIEEQRGEKETEPERMRRLIEEKEARERGEQPQVQKAVVSIPARGAARPAVVPNKAKPFDAEEVRDYLRELGDPDLEEADKFFDYWVSKDWRTKDGPIKDWKARMRYWLRSEFRKPRKKSVGERVREMMERDELNKNR
jgi:hypothetical protein